MIPPQTENPTLTHADITPAPIQLNDLGSKPNMSSTNVSVKGDDKGDARHLEETNDLASSHPHLIVRRVQSAVVRPLTPTGRKLGPR
jgi:hypothetical protein